MIFLKDEAEFHGLEVEDVLFQIDKNSENKWLSILENNYSSDDFAELVLELEEKIEKGILPEKWSDVLDSYYEISPPKTDDFSYLELGDMFIDEFSEKGKVNEKGLEF